jgi:uncharacterized protein (DUF1800 family)
MYQLFRSGGALSLFFLLILAGPARSAAQTSTLTATFHGLGADLTSPYEFIPDGLRDYHISLDGLRGTPAEISVTSDPDGLWTTPFDSASWMVLVIAQSSSAADIHFSEWPGSNFRVRVRYADGTVDQADARPAGPLPTSSLKAVFHGAANDVVSPLALAPDGLPDYRISLDGLRESPAFIEVTSPPYGVWRAPLDPGGYWEVFLMNFSGAAGDLYFSQWPGSNFRVRVQYSDGSSDTADAGLPPPGPPRESDIARFLYQATFGPTPELIAQVKSSGIADYIDHQFTAPMQDYPDLPFWPTNRPTTCTGDCQRDNYTYYQIQKHFYTNALLGEDQLRQRVAFALSEILVTSQVDVPLSSWMRSYQQLLYRQAFGNFRQLLFDATLHPTMGRFLDMQNSRCQSSVPVNANVCRNGLAAQPNENYAREVLQLFSIGTFLLDRSGNRVLDGNGNPIVTYDQRLVEEFSRAFTGWVLAPNLPGPPELPGTTVPNYRDPMVVHLDGQGREDYHDRAGKTLLNGITLLAGRTAAQDLNDSIDNIAYHPNVAPFIVKQLIQRLVTSNPSPDYVARMSDVFELNRNASNQLFIVVRAILLDPEARGGHTDPANFGKLREPVLFITNVLRALKASSDGVLNALTVNGSPIGPAEMNQDLFNAPSVFNYFPPTARVPGESALGPEFAIYSSLSSLRRINLVNRLVFQNIPPAPPNRPLGTAIDLSSWDSLAANTDSLLDQLDTLLLSGSMSAETRLRLRTAIEQVPAGDSRLRVRTAIYLVLTSSQYQIQR